MHNQSFGDFLLTLPQFYILDSLSWRPIVTFELKSRIPASVVSNTDMWDWPLHIRTTDTGSTYTRLNGNLDRPSGENLQDGERQRMVRVSYRVSKLYPLIASVEMTCDRCFPTGLPFALLQTTGLQFRQQSL